MSPRIRFLPEGVSADVVAGATVLDAAILAGVMVDAPCGGEGKCGRCRVSLSGEVEPPSRAEETQLGAEDIARGTRLACQAVVSGDCEVEVPAHPPEPGIKERLLPTETYRVDLTAETLELAARPIGAAVDIGTSTLSVSLIDLETGKRISAASGDNPQSSFGLDVMTRITKCVEDEANLRLMQRLVVERVGECLTRAARRARVSLDRTVRLVAVGNTCMLSIASGIDPSPLGKAPFKLPFENPLVKDAAKSGLPCAEGARLLVPRPISGFIGSDLIGCVLSTGLHRSNRPSLLVDIGTNGEVALCSEGVVTCCSTAAGPAFEGGDITFGMRAARGAIESLSRDGALHPHVIGGGEPRGICGSGLIDAVAALLDSRLLLPSGKFVEREEGERIAPGRIAEVDSMRVFFIDAHRRVYLSQKDVRQTQVAKAALRAGIAVLLKNSGLVPGEIEKVMIAGAFGNFLKPESLVRLGLLPDQLRERIVFVGNAALLGAELMLTSEGRFEEALAIAESARPVELAGNEDFEKEFYRNIPFPG